LSFHGRPAAPEVFEKISAPGARAPRRAEPFEWLGSRSATRTVFSVFGGELQLVLWSEGIGGEQVSRPPLIGLKSATPDFMRTFRGRRDRGASPGTRGSPAPRSRRPPPVGPQHRRQQRRMRRLPWAARIVESALRGPSRVSCPEPC